MILKGDVKFNGKLTCWLKYGIWLILNRGIAGLKIWTLMCYFCQQYIKFQLKKYRGIISHGTEELSKL